MIGKRAYVWPLLLGLVCGPAMASKYNLQEPVTEMARQMYDLHTQIFLICCVIFVIVFGAMFYAIWAHRKSVGFA